MLIDIGEEAIVKVVKHELEDYREALETDLDRIISTQQGFVYDMDWEKDSKIITDKINAINLLLEDYT
jgi:uncharacterized protein YdiU (UPF0061 family)